MKEQNGIIIFEKNDKLPDLPSPELEIGAIPVHSPYGYRLIQLDGVWIWSMATEEDFVKFTAKFLGKEVAEVTKDDIKAMRKCRQKGPRECDVFSCSTANYTCQCELNYDPPTGHYVCLC